MSEIEERWGSEVDADNYFLAQAVEGSVPHWVFSTPPNGMYKARLVNGAWVDQGAAPVAPVEEVQAQVDAERDRRTDAGVMFNGVLYQSRAGDRENISGSAQLAFMAIVMGAQPGDLRWSGADSDFEWIADDNSRVPMDAQTVVEFGKVAAARKLAMIFAGSNLKQMQPIPADFADDQWWPV